MSKIFVYDIVEILIFYVLCFIVLCSTTKPRHAAMLEYGVKGLEEVEELGRNECTLYR